jgi:CRISPR/Cas system-associated exonuclease Cas4 (RecB family)
MLEDAAMCGIKFQRRYGAIFGVWHEQEIIAPGIALTLGTNTHFTAQNDFRNLIENGSLLTAEAISDLGRTNLESLWVAGIELDPVEAFDIKKTHDETVDMAVKLSLLHHNELAPLAKPIEVEKPFVIELDGYPINLKGRMDILEEDAIGDIKTMKADKASVQSGQMAMYATAYKLENGRYPSRAYHHKAIKTKTPKAVVEEIVPDPVWINPLYRRIERLIETVDAVKAGYQAFMPADPNHWICSKKYCGYATTCKFWSGK